MDKSITSAEYADFLRDLRAARKWAGPTRAGPVVFRSRNPSRSLNCEETTDYRIDYRRFSGGAEIGPK